MKDIIGGVIFLIMGMYSAIFYRKCAEDAFEFHNRLRLPHISEKGYRIGFLFVGVVFTVFGILALLQIIKFKQ